MEGTYFFNQESQRVELHFSKAAYNALTPEQKKKLKSTCLFSKSATAWVSRTVRPLLNSHYWTIELAKQLGLTEAQTVGEALTPAEQQERRQERAGERADRFSDRAHKASQESRQALERSSSMLSVIPMGQPILVGHHSERGHRALLGRADNAMRNSVEAGQKADHYQHRAAVANSTASARELKDPAFLNRRVEEHAAALRRLERMRPDASASYAEHLDGLLEVEQEKLAYYRELLEAAGGVGHSKESLTEARAGFVHYMHSWYPIQRLNGKSVTVKNWLGVATFTWPVPYAEIKGLRPVDAPEQVTDREGNVVAPSVKYK